MNTGNRAIVYLTEGGRRLAGRLQGLYPDASLLAFKREDVKHWWRENRALIFIMATGIVVRTIAPLVEDKKTDPAVVVLDEKGRFAISLLSGHLGGANDMAREIAAFLGGEAVVTTASDLYDLTPLDLWAREHDLIIENENLLPEIMGRLIRNGLLSFYVEEELSLPPEFFRTTDPTQADVIISNRQNISSGGHGDRRADDRDRLYLRPRNLILGVGCNSQTTAEEIESAVLVTLRDHYLSPLSLAALATLEKKGGERGLVAFAEKYRLPILLYKADELNRVTGVERSEAAFVATGAQAVAEPAALLAAGAQRLLIKKEKRGNVTVALAVRPATERNKYRPYDPGAGRLYIVGTGPGSIEHITPYARRMLAKAEVIVGYRPYLDLIEELLAGKEVIAGQMTEEVKRCTQAVELALQGRRVAVISGGDPGIYAMAGLVLEIWREKCHELDKAANRQACRSDIDIEVIPGISALNAAAAKLGAPLMHDFAAVSLSDRLTPWDLIAKRLEAAAAADFVVVLYNPKSKGRPGQIRKAREIFLRHRLPETPVGIVRGAWREGEKIILTNLAEFLNHPIDMQTTVIIGNSNTSIWNNLMITPRGYGL